MENGKKLSYKSVVALGFLVYFFSYAMRLDYAAAIVAIVKDPVLNVDNSLASLAVTGSFITYGIGQIICGFIGDKVSPTKMMSLAMLGTIIVNLSVSFCSNIWLITALWCINGVCQAMLWPPLTRLVAELIGTERYSNAITIVGLSASTGTIFIYLLVPFILKYLTWRWVFRVMAFFGFIIMLVWLYSTRNVKMGKAVAQVKTNDQKTISVWGLIMLAGLIPIFLAIATQGFLRDGIQTWLPSLVNETFPGLDESSSVLSTAILPVFSMICVLVANAIYNKLKHELKTAAVMYGIAFAASVPLIIFSKNLIVTLVAAALISAAMHGVNHMLICLVPKNFAKYGMVSTFSGILNACTYVGASISTYGFASVSENYGWYVVLVCWFVLALVGTLVCTFKVKGWSRFIAK